MDKIICTSITCPYYSDRQDNKCAHARGTTMEKCKKFLITESEPVAKLHCSDGLGATSREEEIIEFEMARNEAMDKYFTARPQLFRTREKECLFEAGFRMAWEKR